MNYQHINTGIEKGLEEEELAIALPPLNLTQTSTFSLLIDNRIVDCLIARQQKVLGLTFVGTNYQLLASYTLLFTPDHSGYVWNNALETLKLNLHKASRNPIWRHPLQPEGDTWLIGISYAEQNRLTEPYAIAICRQFLNSARCSNSLQQS